MEAVYAALIAMGSAVIVKVLDWVFSRNDKTAKALEAIREKVDRTQAEVKELGEEMKEDHAIQCRQRILCFSDDLLHGVEHSREYYDAVLQDITEYDYYSERHPGFKNSVTGQAAKNILKHYEAHMWGKDFL